MRFLALVVFSCASALVARAEESDAPSELNARIGGGLEGFYTIQLKGQALAYTDATRGRAHRSGDPRKATVKPTAKQWKDFRAKLDAISVWSWEREYKQPGVYDGTQWDVKISYGAKTIESRGDNAYPPGFDRYLEAVQALLGHLRFE